MSNAIFWDASAFIALANQRDQWHELAKQRNLELAQQKLPRLTTSAVLTEVADGLSKIGQRPMAYQLLAAVRAPSPIPTVVVHIDEQLWFRGWHLYQSRADKEWGLTDCLSFVVMDDHQIRHAFTADHHFAQAGFTCLLR